jgi:hypothetical protein
VATSVPGVKIEAKRCHSRIISSLVVQTQNDCIDETVIETNHSITKVRLHAAA